MAVPSKSILDMGSNKIINILDGTDANDAMSLGQFDAAINSRTSKKSVLVATTANITLSGLQTIDGVSVTAGQRVLVKNQSTGSQNGIYVSSSGAWTRDTDFDTNTEADNGLLVYVRRGSTQSGQYWKLDTVAFITIGTTSLSFSQVFTTTVSIPLNDIAAATATNIIDSLNFQQAWNWSTISTSTALSLSADALTTAGVLAISSNNNSLNSTSGLLYVSNEGSSVNGAVFKVKANSAVSGAGMIVMASGRVGIGTTTPVAPLSVAGAPNVSNIGVSGMMISLDASLGINDQSTAASGTVANTAVVGITAPTLFASNTSVTYTNSSTVYIAGPPVASTNVTITNPYAFYVNSGNVYFGGSIGLGRKPAYPIDVNSTGAIRIPVGTVAQQPTAAAGLIRLNSDNPSFDYHDGTAWRTVITTAVGAVGQGAGNNQITYFSTPGNITSNSNGSFNGTFMGLGGAFVTNQRLTITGSSATSGSYSLRIHNSGGSNNQFVVRDDGRVGVLTSDPLKAFHVVGQAIFGDSGTAGNATRALNLTSTDAVMRILRISAVSATAAPSLELMHRTTSDGANTVYYDIFGDSTGLSFRDRQNLSDVKVLQVGLNGTLTNRCVDAATSALVVTQTYTLNSSGAVAANFGHRALWQLESSTTNDQDAAAIDTFWTTATHGSRTAATTLSTAVSGTLTEHLRLGSKRVSVSGQFVQDVFALTDGATINTEWDNGNTQTVTLGGNRTMGAPTNPQSGAKYTYIIRQDATGSRTLTWFTIKWAGGSAPTLTTTANKYDIFELDYDGTNYYGTIKGQNF